MPDQFDLLPWHALRLVTIVLAHNETGVIQDLKALSDLCRDRQVPLHVDALQATGKIPVDFHELNAAAMSVGAHKFHGPRGIGALLLREGTTWSASSFGGHQESGRRPGTEAVPLIAGMARALELWNDARFAVRTLARNRAFALLAILTLGLGIGASSTLFSVVNALLLRPLPFHAPQRLAWITNYDVAGLSGQTTQVNHMNFLREHSHSFTDIAGYMAFYGVGDDVLGGQTKGSFFYGSHGRLALIFAWYESIIPQSNARSSGE